MTCLTQANMASGMVVPVSANLLYIMTTFWNSWEMVTVLMWPIWTLQKRSTRSTSWLHLENSTPWVSQDRWGRWIHSFLTHRTQSVLVNSVRSDPSPVKSGVPQGSVLGLLSFLVLIGDIDRNVSHAFLSSFADDTTIASQIASPTDSENLQTDLEVVYQWAEDNNMELNVDKFEYMHYGACYNQEAHSISLAKGASFKSKGMSRTLDWQ